jgi:hypothetical protein
LISLRILTRCEHRGETHNITSVEVGM